MPRHEARPIWYYQVPFGFWTESKNRRAYMEWLERKLRIREPEDWYDLTTATIRRFGGDGLLGHYGNSLIAMISDYVPWYDWKEWLFPMVPIGFWDVAENRHRYLEWLGEQLGFREPEDWYSLTCTQLLNHRGSGLLTRFKNLFGVVTAHFPQHRWLEWRFRKVPVGFWDDPANRRRYLEWLGEELGFREPEDWYKLSLWDLRANDGDTLVTRLGGPASIVTSVFPEVEWYPWRFEAVPKGFWDDPANVRWYFAWLSKKLGFKKMEDWYRLQVNDMAANHGFRLIGQHGSAAAAVMAAFPEYEWQEWRFTATPSGFWKDPANIRRYLEWLGDRLGFQEPEDWYKLRARDVKRNGGAGMPYRDSPPTLVPIAFPEYDWKEWWFDHPPARFWDNPDNARRYLDWLGKELGFQEMEDWYRLRVVDFQMFRGRGLLVRFRSSPGAIVMHYFPDYPWLPWKFAHLSGEFWNDPTHCRRYLEWLGEELGYEKPEDWYQLRGKDFILHRGIPLLSRYEKSPARILKTFMPEHDWKEWLFCQVRSSFWSDRGNRRRYLEWLADELGIRDAEGWGRLRRRHLQENRGMPLVRAYRYSIRNLILDTFPKSHPAVKGTRPTREKKRKRRKTS